ncbi:MAG: hypothetical protein MMC23_009165 [Stictis urceolatum]|nr:hypothetical protein [Stictis urceolata]
MHQPALQPLIYRRLFPRPQPTDPTDFTQFVAKCIIPEVRQETHRFYGPEDTLECNYPGLDYASKAHRTRLRSYPWHRRLFRVFDELRLSEGEVHQICKWEGTRYSKERFEREHKTQIRDTTWDGVKSYGKPFLGVQSVGAPMVESPSRLRPSRTRGEQNFSVLSDEAGFTNEMSETDDDVLRSSVGTELHRRLLAATAARARGEPAILDNEWEQWMKDVTERGLMSSRPESSAAAGPSAWPHSYSAYPLSFPTLQPSSRTLSPSSPQYGTSSSDSFHYNSSSASYFSRSQSTEAHRRMAPPPLHLIPRIRVPRESGHPRSSASPAT